MYDFDKMMARRLEAEEDMKRVQEAQDGSFAHNIPAVFVGGKYNGLMVDHKTLMKMKSTSLEKEQHLITQEATILVNTSQ